MSVCWVVVRRRRCSFGGKDFWICALDWFGCPNPNCAGAQKAVTHRWDLCGKAGPGNPHTPLLVRDAQAMKQERWENERKSLNSCKTEC